MAGRSPTRPSHKNIAQLLPTFLGELSRLQQDRPDLILAAWPLLIGSRLAPMTRAVSFVSGVLLVKVRSSSLLSVLSQHELPRLLKELRQKFPNVSIRTIRFAIG